MRMHIVTHAKIDTFYLQIYGKTLKHDRFFPIFCKFALGI